MTQVTWATLVAAVRSGQSLISFPTDTVPALAARPDCADLIFTAKQRQPDKPLILMGATPTDLWRYVNTDLPDWPTWQRVAERYWPGALTLVLPASDDLPHGLNPLDASTIGLRIPAWPPARSLLQQTGPLATTSINRSGQPALTQWAEIQEQFPQVLTPVQAEWQLPDNPDPQPSTVVKWQPGGWQILRSGAVKFAVS
jgi:L-threonylcarbamoyladenylate synthase